MPHRSLSQFVADTLVERAPALASRWQDRAQAATPRQPPRPPPAHPGPSGGADGVGDGTPDRRHAERLLRALADEVVASTAAAALLAGDAADAAGVSSTSAPSADAPPNAVTDARPSANVMQLGWQAGTRAFDAGLSVHHVVRDAELLLAVVLADLERALDPPPAGVDARASAALGAARRLQRAMARYTQAAASGFVHALLRTLRERYRLLRHDLRNPLGTIRSALSLMEDESVPEEMRHGPGIRSMVARNAGSLDQLIGSSLDDAAADALLIPPQDVAMRDVALVARREVREAARLAGCAVVIGDVPADPPSRVDPAGLELTLTALLLAALAHANPGDAVRVDATPDASPRLGESSDGHPRPVVRVTVSRTADADGSPRWDAHGLALAASLAADHGGAVRATVVAEPTDPGSAPPPDPESLVGADSLYLYLPRVEEAAAPG